MFRFCKCHHCQAEDQEEQHYPHKSLYGKLEHEMKNHQSSQPETEGQIVHESMRWKNVPPNWSGLSEYSENPLHASDAREKYHFHVKHTINYFA
jgi:hypothetical protein